jgi:hypothetical protein
MFFDITFDQQPITQRLKTSDGDSPPHACAPLNGERAGVRGENWFDFKFLKEETTCPP